MYNQNLFIKDVLTKAGVGCPPTLPIDRAVTTMAQDGCSCLIVTEGGVPVGILTEHDLVKIIPEIAHQSGSVTRPVSDFMSSPAVIVSEDSPVFEALVLCESRGVRELPVVGGDGRLSGLVTQSDLIKVQRLVLEHQEKVIEAAVGERTKALADAYAELKAWSLEDPLLRIGNRRAMEVDLAYTHETARRYSQTYSLILLDVDNFKEFNDEYGHLAGDKALKSLADFLRETIRRSDRVYRFGGEEILLLLPETDAQDAAALAERVAVGVQALEIIYASSAYGCLTVSCGVASSSMNPEDSAWQAVLSRADGALYDAKRSGKNRVASRSAA